MKTLGVVEDVSYRGMLIVRSSSPPGVGAVVVDRRNRKVGRVVALLGPVKRPFVLVEPFRDGGKGIDLVGATLHLA